MKLTFLSEIQDSDVYLARFLARKGAIELEMAHLEKRMKSLQLRIEHSDDPTTQTLAKREYDKTKGERDLLKFDLDDIELKLIELGKTPDRRFGYERLVARPR